jgi:hypothetical protein
MYLCVSQDVRNHIAVCLETMNIQSGFGKVVSFQGIHEELVQVVAEMIDAGCIERGLHHR